MSPAIVFNTHLVLGYVAWLLCFAAYIWPRLKSMERVEAQRAIDLSLGFPPVSPASPLMAT